LADADVIPFWSYFSSHGGVDVLGYPISKRFTWDGYVCQAMQRGVLQWDESDHQVHLANIMDFLAVDHRDEVLLKTNVVPPAIGIANETGLSIAQIRATRQQLLEEDNALAPYYRGLPSA